MSDWIALRKDLVVTEKHENGDRYVLLHDPVNDEIYEFGEQEWFLLQCMDGSTNPDDLIGKYAERFSAELTQEQLDTFISMISRWGLVTGRGAVARVTPGGSVSVNDDIIDIPLTDVTEIFSADRPFKSRQRRQQSAPEESVNLTLVLFNPERIALGLHALLSPLRWMRYLLPFLMIVSCVLIFNHLQVFIYDFLRFRRPLSIVLILIIHMFTVNFTTQLLRAAIARGSELTVDQFGIKLVLGVIPRFAIRTSSLDGLSRQQRIGYYWSSLKIRLWIFSLMTVLWYMTRMTGTLLPVICLMLLTASAASFLLAINPLYNSDGYKLLSSVLDMPNLRQKAYHAFFHKEDGVLADRLLQEDNLFALRSYALASIIFMIVFMGGLIILAARWFEFNYQGTGVVIYLALTGSLIWRLYSRFVTKRTEMQEKRAKIEAAIAARSNPGSTTGAQRPGRRNRKPEKKTGWWNRVKAHKVRSFLLVVFLIVLFLPYPYETGGVLQVLPDKQNEIYAETPGVITSVLVKSGDFIKAGTVVATLTSSEQEKNLLTTQASILEQQAKLEQLRSTPRPEDIEVAKTLLTTAKTQFKFTSESARRLEALYKDGNVALDKYQDEQRKMEVDRNEVDEAKANLDKVIAGPHPKEIEAAEYELHRLQEKGKFEQEDLDRTKLHMPLDGHIVTKNLDHMVGQYLHEGDHFVTVENDERMRIEIQVPESDISDVVLGANARFKVWAYGDRLFYGNVSEIAPTALEETYGKVVVVTVVIQNEGHLLKSGMTGFGKVDGGTKLVVVAFTRMLVRFFTIEMWSWIP